MTKQRSYFTKSEVIDFAKWIVSDERRHEKRVELQEKIKKGISDPTPSIIAERRVEEEDFVKWNEKRLKA
tara:strand:- start:150 stop:359 length:210 start_codon:yes stop_codon:yes gene_type:complete